MLHIILSCCLSILFKHDYPQLVTVITQDEYDILVITQVRGETEDEC